MAILAEEYIELIWPHTEDVDLYIDPTVEEISEIAQMIRSHFGASV